MQRSTTTIGEVVPTLLFSMSVWKKLAVKPSFKTLCNTMITCFKDKFKFELESDYYAAAALLNTSSLQVWANKTWGRDYAAKAYECLIGVVEDFSKMKLARASEPNSQAPATNLTTDESSDDDDDDDDDDGDGDDYISRVLQQVCVIMCIRVCRAYGCVKVSQGLRSI
jgi:hypothetical protein